jgi:acyl-CoA synthetase (AMP-forming)/AMP-acid ligase II
VPVNPRLAGPEIAYILDHSGASVLITDPGFADLVSDIRGDLSALGPIVFADAAPVAGATTWASVLDQGEPAPFQVDTVDDDPCLIHYTSGTTGRPKGALTTVGSRWWSLFHVFANEICVCADDVMLHAASLAHGTAIKVLPHYLKGATNVTLRRFEVDAFCAAVEAYGGTTTWMVPTMIAMLVEAARTGKYDLSSLHTIMYAGAPMPEALLDAAIDLFGSIFVQIYGLAEAPQPDLVLPKEDHVPDPATGRQRRPGVTGRQVIGSTARVVDDDGRDVAPGDVGEILIAGPHIMREYWNDPEATAETLRDGWCYTGDLAKVDDDGYVYIVDRRKDMIISGGFNVYPKEIEDALYTHPAVRECAVIGRPDPFWGETVEAVVALHRDGGATAEDLVTHCSERLAGYKKPRQVTFLDELPKTATGKIDKKSLRRRDETAGD